MRRLRARRARAAPARLDRVSRPDEVVAAGVVVRVPPRDREAGDDRTRDRCGPRASSAPRPTAMPRARAQRARLRAAQIRCAQRSQPSTKRCAHGVVRRRRATWRERPCALRACRRRRARATPRPRSSPISATLPFVARVECQLIRPFRVEVLPAVRGADVAGARAAKATSASRQRAVARPAAKSAPSATQALLSRPLAPRCGASSG